MKQAQWWGECPKTCYRGWQQSYGMVHSGGTTGTGNVQAKDRWVIGLYGVALAISLHFFRVMCTVQGYMFPQSKSIHHSIMLEHSPR